MKTVTYIIAMLALLSGAAWGWQTVLTQMPPAKIAAGLPTLASADASMKAEAQPADAVPQYARFARNDTQAGPSPIYPATPGKQLLGTVPPLPRAVVAHQKQQAKALAAMAKASPREAKVASHDLSAKPQAPRVARSFAANGPLQLHPQEESRAPARLASAYHRQFDNEPSRVMGFASERRLGLLETLFD